MTTETTTVYGPAASVQLPLRVDTGAKNTILEASMAARLGLPDLGPASVDTYGMPVTWRLSEGYVATPGLEPVRVPIWIAPDGSVPALGETAMATLGYKLVRPAPNIVTAPLRSPAAAAAQPGDDFGYAYRLGVCRSCPDLHSGLIDRCSLCGCPVRSKALFANGCPAGRF